MRTGKCPRQDGAEARKFADIYLQLNHTAQDIRNVVFIHASASKINGSYFQNYVYFAAVLIRSHYGSWPWSLSVRLSVCLSARAVHAPNWKVKGAGKNSYVRFSGQE